jgi:hypothetical protein
MACCYGYLGLKEPLHWENFIKFKVSHWPVHLSQLPQILTVLYVKVRRIIYAPPQLLVLLTESGNPLVVSESTLLISESASGGLILLLSFCKAGWSLLKVCMLLLDCFTGC